MDNHSVETLLRNGVPRNSSTWTFCLNTDQGHMILPFETNGIKYVKTASHVRGVPSRSVSVVYPKILANTQSNIFKISCQYRMHIYITFSLSTSKPPTLVIFDIFEMWYHLILRLHTMCIQNATACWTTQLRGDSRVATAVRLCHSDDGYVPFEATTRWTLRVARKARETPEMASTIRDRSTVGFVLKAATSCITSCQATPVYRCVCQQSDVRDIKRWIGFALFHSLSKLFT